jgi:murein DD-endopeptidase MepM/ murein hydrolase activator NlpD
MERSVNFLRTRSIRIVLVFFALAFLAGLFCPEKMVIPVQGATTADWNHETFWYYPWGRSVVHKGIDIFAAEGQDVNAATGGIIVRTRRSTTGGGNTVVVLGPKWRLHYYAHLKEISVSNGEHVARGDCIGTVGTTGNAIGKPAHLHYSIVTAVPHPWRIDSSRQGYLKMFFLDPGKKLLDAFQTRS